MVWPLLAAAVFLVPGGKFAAGELQWELQRVGEEVAEVLEWAGMTAPSKALAQPLRTVHHSSLGFPAHGILLSWRGILGLRLLLHAIHSHLQHCVFYSPLWFFFYLWFLQQQLTVGGDLALFTFTLFTFESSTVLSLITFYLFIKASFR